MKLGKKVLSCVLAIMMIVSSISVSFSVFAATDTTDDIFATIETHYSGLKQAITAATRTTNPDTSGVPTGSNTTWTVEKDTYTGGWLAVARAFADYAKGTVAKNGTLNALVNAIEAEVPARVSTYGAKLSADDYKAVLEYFRFNTTATDSYGSDTRITLTIGNGYDLLAWSSVEDMDVDRTYADATLKFTAREKSDDGSGYVLKSTDDISFTATEVIDADGKIMTEVQAVQEVLSECVDSTTFAAWYTQVDAGTPLTTEQLAAYSKLSTEFDLTVELTGSGYTPVEVWDHYVAARVGKTYAEAAAWYETAGAEAEAKPYADRYKASLDELMATDISAYTAEQLMAHYQQVEAVVQQIESNAFAAVIKKLMNKAEADYIGKSSTKVETYLNDLGVKIAKAYAPTFEEALKNLADSADNIKTSSDYETSEEWEASDDYKNASTWLVSATDLIGKIDTYVLNFADFDEIDGLLSQDNYNKVSDKIGVVSLDINGATYVEEKAAMDKMMSSLIFEGRTYSTLTENAEEYRAMYLRALELKNNSSLEAVYTTVYPNGLDEYTAYMNSLKAAVAQRIYDNLSQVIKYYDEGGGVKYYNFEAIIAAWNAVESTEATLKNFLAESPEYAPDSDLDQVTLDSISALFTKAQSYYNEAGDFQKGLNNLRNAAYNASDSLTSDKKVLSYILKQEEVTNTKYGWESALSSLDLTKIRKFVNDIELTQYGTANLNDIKNLMSSAVEDLDKILVSDDIGTLLNSLTAKEDEDGNTTSFLGTWKYTYTFYDIDGKTKITRNAGDEVKNVREFLINTILGLLWGGSVQTTLFKLLNETIGGAVYNMAAASSTDLKVTKKDLWQFLPEILHMGLPTMPHDYVENWYNPLTGSTSTTFKTMDSKSADWYKFFTGAAFGASGNSEYDYTMILKVLDTAPIDTHVGTEREARSYWKPFTYGAISTGDRHQYKPGDEIGLDLALNPLIWSEGSEDQIPFCGSSTSSCTKVNGVCTNPDHYFNSENCWHVNSWSAFYRTMAVATCGIHVPLAELLTKKHSLGESTYIFTETDIAGLNATIPINNTGDSLYDRLFIPLYRLLGIEGYYDASTNPGGYYGYDDIRHACGTFTNNNNMGVTCSSIRNSGLTIWTYLLQPIIYWMENELFVSPVKTIAELLPNLLAMLE